MRVVPGCQCDVCARNRTRNDDDLAARLARIVANEIRGYVGCVDVRDVIVRDEVRIG